MKKRGTEDPKQNGDRWLLTYSDMMNNLLVLFIVMYAMSVVDLAKFKEFAKQFNSALGDSSVQTLDSQSSEKDGTEADPEESEGEELPDEFDKVFEQLKTKIAEQGYEDSILIEKGEGFIKFRFGDNVLFYPDSPTMKNDSVNILKAIGDLLLGVENITESIEIDGHTANVGTTSNSFFSWELSSDRAIAVLKFLTQICNLPQSKMSVSGYSKYQPIAENDTEDGRELNRRVEIKITRISEDAQ